MKMHYQNRRQLMKHKFIDIKEIRCLSLEDSLHYMEWTASNGVELAVIAPTYTEQEIVKPYLEKIRAEIEKQEKWLLQAGYNTYNVDIAFNSIKLALAENEEWVNFADDLIPIIDRTKEQGNGNDD